MENRNNTSRSNRPIIQSSRLWYVLGVGGVLLVILGGLVAWLPWHRQVQAIAEIERLGGFIETERAGPDWLRNFVDDEGMVGFDRVVNVGLSGTQITEFGLVQLGGLTELQTLRLEGTQVTDAGLEHIKGLTKLQILVLHDTQVTDVGLVDLKTSLPGCVIRTHPDRPLATAE
jgi:Leucine-rich repeat (LRR) protein